MTHTPTPWHVDAYGCHNDYKLRLCEPMRYGFPLATIAQFQYNWRDAGQYDRKFRQQCRIEAAHQNAINHAAMDRRMIENDNRFPCDWTAQEKHDATVRLEKGKV